ncbi:MAG: hypothetical protein QF600_06145 [Verrucomicrobiota bacterium]|jgi:hypothetical protein|nr:hypothetical protein [Verrucomicrobiota bacterium]
MDSDNNVNRQDENAFGVFDVTVSVGVSGSLNAGIQVEAENEEQARQLAYAILNARGYEEFVKTFGTEWQTYNQECFHLEDTELNDIALNRLAPSTAEKLVQKREEDTEYNGEYPLDLTGLEELPPALAGILAKHRGPVLLPPKFKDALKPFRTMPPDVAQAFIDGQTDALFGYRYIDDAAAEILGEHRGTLELEGLRELSAEAAEGLSRVNGFLHLDGLEKVSDQVAEALGRSGHQHGLTLGKVKELSPYAAECLGRRKGGLRLDGLGTKALSAPVAIGLVQNTEWIVLDGIRKISKEIAEALCVTSPDPLWIYRPDSWDTLGCGLYLRSAEEIEDLEPFANHPNHVALGLRSLTLEQAQILSQHAHYLDLPYLRKMTPEAAEALAQHKGYLVLKGYDKWDFTEPVAEALSRHQGGLNLDGLRKLSDESAKALAQHQGHLSLRGLTAMSSAAGRALSRHQGPIFAKANIRKIIGERAHKTLDLGTLRSSVLAFMDTRDDLYHLDEYSEIDLAAARFMGKMKIGFPVCLKIRKLSDEGAEALAQFECQEFHLDELTELSDTAARYLAAAKSPLCVDLDLWPSSAKKALLEEERLQEEKGND